MNCDTVAAWDDDAPRGSHPRRSVTPGFLDGRAGLTYCRLLAIYEYLIVLKTRELLAEAGGRGGVTR